jgi:predicted O-methyltransferase YrrM
MAFSRIFNYLNYKLLSRHRNGHGLHSPFVYDLISRVFRNKTDERVVLNIERIRKNMFSDKRTITVNDLGSGSRSMKTELRKVSDIAKHSPVSCKYGKLLSNMAAGFGGNMIIELGTSLGISSMYMAASRPGATVYTIEGSSEVAGIAKENFSKSDIKNIKLLEGSFDDVLPYLLTQVGSPGLVFIDGNHRREPVLKYFKMLSEYSDSNTVIIIDDINYSSEMNEAWNELKQNTKVSVSIDLFRMGILFFREGISKAGYTIRY